MNAACPLCGSVVELTEDRLPEHAERLAWWRCAGSGLLVERGPGGLAFKPIRQFSGVFYGQ